MTTEMVSCWHQWFVLARVSAKRSNTLANSITICVVPTRLFALKYGAKLVWGPEMVDKAMLHAERVVDRACVDFLFHYNPKCDLFSRIWDHLV